MWVGLGLLSAVILLLPDLPVAASNPLLAVAMASISGVVGLALLQLGLMRFSVLGDRLDLYIGLGFGTLATANLAVRVLLPATGAEPGYLETTVYLLLLARAVAVGLFALGVARAGAGVASTARARQALGLAVGVVAVLVLGGALIVLANGHLPAAAGAVSRELIAAGAPIPDLLPGQSLLVLLLTGGLAALLFLLTLVLTVLWRRSGDAHLGTLAVAFTLLSVAQAHTALVGAVPIDYVTTADIFRLAAYLWLLSSLVTRLRADIAAQAAQEERLHLSRELHDGLLQQLSLLGLRLQRAAEPDRPPDRRARDLEVATRVWEAALLEARQTTVALRTGWLAWEELGRAVAALAGEFGQGHEVDVRTQVAETGPEVDAGLQVELLRIVQEACSNAVRHGRATRLDVALRAEAEVLHLEIRDNGSGFDPQRAQESGGLGLRSMRERLERRGGALTLTAAPGQGASIEARVPVPGRRGG